MARNLTTIKRSLTRDEKKKVINSYRKNRIPLPNDHTYQSFMNADIQDEFIIMKCDKCGFEEEIQYDFIKAYLEHYPDLEYPEGICDKCGGNTIPLDIYNEQFKK